MTAVGAAARYDSIALVTGADSARIENRIVIADEGAYAEAGGALLARKAQKLEGVTVLRHGVPRGTSRQVWRSVADDRATCSVAARVEVARDAQKTDGEQSLKGLLLDRAATINVKPELEIFADDVKCAHGATVGDLDREPLFYLRARGIDETDARALLIQAFICELIDSIKEEPVHAYFRNAFAHWLEEEGITPP
jgi:Fe-S cluster assembly protein SufD